MSVQKAREQYWAILNIELLTIVTHTGGIGQNVFKSRDRAVKMKNDTMFKDMDHLEVVKVIREK